MGLLRRANQFLKDFWPLLFGSILSINTVVLSIAFLNIDRRADGLAASQYCRNISGQIDLIYNKESAKLFDFIRRYFLANTDAEQEAILESARTDLRPLRDILQETQVLEQRLTDDENCQIVLIPGTGIEDQSYRPFSTIPPEFLEILILQD